MVFTNIKDPKDQVRVETSIEERKQAEQKYEEALKNPESNQTAVLGSYSTLRSNELMSFKIGNFPPGFKASVTCMMFAEN